jgi:pyruvate formate lyase activating enzyme
MAEELAGWRATAGAITNIQHYSIHDGPGIRTTVFFQGCPLGCWWCQNPETRLGRPQLFFDVRKCQGCGACVAACPNHAVQLASRDGLRPEATGHRPDGFVSRTDRLRCEGIGACARVCPNDARTLMGRVTTAGEAFDEAAADAMFYEGDGGITLSGGEPLAQPDFAVALLALCRAERIHAALDTCGQADWPTVERVLSLANLVLYDLKHMDPDAHAAGTGVSNGLILENARRIHHELRVPMRIRVPVVPGMNDDDENLEATARFVARELSPSVPVHLIPYHKFGLSKYILMERDGSHGGEPPAAERMEALRTLVASFGLDVVIGG